MQHKDYRGCEMVCNYMANGTETAAALRGRQRPLVPNNQVEMSMSEIAVVMSA
jgi:hypothetical protein